MTIIGNWSNYSSYGIELGLIGDWSNSIEIGVSDNAYLIFRRTPSTGEPFDPEVDEPVAIVPPEQLTYDDEELAEAEYDWQVFARKVE